MSTVYKLLGLDWTSKAKAIDYIYSMRPLYKNGERIKAHDALLLVAATDLHAVADQKRGCGISHFTVEQAGKDRCFWLHRTDGTSTDISFKHIFDDPAKRELREREDRLKAMRQAIDWQVEPRRKRGYHVHHDPSFDTLVKGWLASRGLTLEQIEVTPTADGELRCEMVDAVFKADWAAYHLEHARYEVLTIAEHRARHKKGGKP
jgi:hypothetical protein